MRGGPALAALCLLAAGCAAPAQAGLAVARFEVRHTHCGPPVEAVVEVRNNGTAAARDVVVRFLFARTLAGAVTRHWDNSTWGDLPPGGAVEVSRTVDLPDRCSPFDAYTATVTVEADGAAPATLTRDAGF